MRTTVTLDEDVAAVVQAKRRQEGLGVSEAVNRLIRAGLAKPDKPTAYVHRTFNVGLKVDVSNIGSVLEVLDDA